MISTLYAAQSITKKSLKTRVNLDVLILQTLLRHLSQFSSNSVQGNRTFRRGPYVYRSSLRRAGIDLSIGILVVERAIASYHQRRLVLRWPRGTSGRRSTTRASIRSLSSCCCTSLSPSVSSALINRPRGPRRRSSKTRTRVRHLASLSADCAPQSRKLTEITEQSRS